MQDTSIHSNPRMHPPQHEALLAVVMMTRGCRRLVRYCENVMSQHCRSSRLMLGAHFGRGASCNGVPGTKCRASRALSWDGT